MLLSEDSLIFESSRQFVKTMENISPVKRMPNRFQPRQQSFGFEGQEFSSPSHGIQLSLHTTKVKIIFSNHGSHKESASRLATPRSAAAPSSIPGFEYDYCNILLGTRSCVNYRLEPQAACQLLVLSLACRECKFFVGEIRKQCHAKRNDNEVKLDQAFQAQIKIQVSNT